MKSTGYVLELRGICKQFPGVKALDHVDLRLRPGRVYALMGENGAGKSTLMKCLFGIYAMDEGEVYLDGQHVQIRQVTDARNLGISIIQQELDPIMDRSIMENMWLGREPRKGFLIDDKKMYQDTEKILRQFHLDLSPKRHLRGLTVATLQLLEILTAVTCGARVVIMDEPTSALTLGETEQLFSIIRELRENGVAVVYISHKMDEIYRICDDVTVMRDGTFIAEHELKDVTMDQLIQEMVGRSLDSQFSNRRRQPPGEVVLEAENLSCKGCFQNVNLTLRRGEILGIAGLVGAGRTEILEALFGLRPVIGGNVTLYGKPANIRKPLDAIEQRMAFLTEDRRFNGIFGVLNITDNTLIASYSKFLNRLGLIQKRQSQQSAANMSKHLKVKASSMDELIQNLSGGNQQKVLLVRWLLTNADIFLFDEPTRGIDIGAKAEIYAIMTELCEQGKSIIMVSSEMTEILKMSDRILVMHEGWPTGEVSREEASEDVLMKLAVKNVKEKPA